MLLWPPSSSPLSSWRLVAAPPAKPPPLTPPTHRETMGGLKPTMQMASFVLPRVTEAPGRGWEHQSSPSPAHPHPDLCPGPFVQAPKRGKQKGEERGAQGK